MKVEKGRYHFQLRKAQCKRDYIFLYVHMYMYKSKVKVKTMQFTWTKLCSTSKGLAWAALVVFSSIVTWIWQLFWEHLTFDAYELLNRNLFLSNCRNKGSLKVFRLYPAGSSELIDLRFSYKNLIFKGNQCEINYWVLHTSTKAD